MDARLSCQTSISGHILPVSGYSDAPTLTLETLQVLHWLHPAAITFENLDPLMKRPVRLHVDIAYDQLVAQRRGGYCYEQNTLFAAILRSLGYA